MAPPVTKPEPLNAQDLETYLAHNNIPAEMLYLDAPTPTVEAAAQVVGAVPDQIIKSILFLVDGDPVMAISNGTAPVERRVLARRYQVGRKRVKLGTPQQVLDITGYSVGTVPPFGHYQVLPTLLNQTVLDHPVVYGGGGALNTLMRLDPQTLLDITGAEVIDLINLPD